jgi:taurine dioxygenase
MQITKLHPFGSEVTGIDCSQPLTNQAVTELKSIHLQEHLLIFRDQQITPDKLIALSKNFGTLASYNHPVLDFPLPDQPEVLVLSNIVKDGKPLGMRDAGLYWHADSSWKEYPGYGTFLHAQLLPEQGGDTLFADQQAAYDDLSAAMKQQLQGLRAEHVYYLKYDELQSRNPWRQSLTDEQRALNPPRLQSIVQQHPVGGFNTLWVNPHFTSRIDGLPEKEGRELLQFLFEHTTKPRYVYRHKWKPFDIVFWDNRALMHMASGTPEDCPRIMHRTCVVGHTRVA